MPEQYQVVVVGGGPAGLTTALYTTRLGHDTALIDRGGGRAAMMLDTHNVIGVPEAVSGVEFLQTALEQIQAYGADHFRSFVSAIEPHETGFKVFAGEDIILTDHVVLATGFSDVRPDPPLPRTGKGLHYCLHCDAYMFIDQPVYVMGAGESAAQVAMIMLNFTPDVDLLTRGEEPTWSDETQVQLENHPITIIDAEITAIEKDDDGWLSGFEFSDGTTRPYRGGFPMYGSSYNTALAEMLDLELTDGGQIAVDDHGRTNVDGVYAVGDVTPGHNQIPVAMGEGAACGIAIHMALLEYQKSVEAINRDGPVQSDAVPAISDRLRERASSHAGGPQPSQPADSD